MRNNLSQSSLSSFQNQQPPNFNPTPPIKSSHQTNQSNQTHLIHPTQHKQTLINPIPSKSQPQFNHHIHKSEYQHEQFSQFEDEDGDGDETGRYRANLEKIQRSSVQVINKLKQEIVGLKAENRKLTYDNISLMEQIDRYKHTKTLLQTKLLQTKLPQSHPNPHPNHPPPLPPKLQTLQSELLQIKQTTKKLRQQSQKDTAQILILKQKLQKYQRIEAERQVEWNWKNRFIGLFIDMLGKICQGVDQGWSQKRKIGVGWKIVKNVVDKAISAGIRVPRVIKTRE